LQTILYSTATEQAVDWYSKVLGTEPAYRSDVWTSFEVGGAHLAIHHVDEPAVGSRAELSLVSDTPLEAVVERLISSGIHIEKGIQEETFGRSLLLKDPDEYPVQINEYAG
jgi:uncharacterized glyoxalase superfamily protein PhnB